MKRVIAVILTVALLLCGCEPVTDNGSELLGAYSGEETEAETAAKTSVTMLFYPDMDVDPVTTDVYANHELLKLVYCPLYRAGSELRSYAVLADSAKVDGLTVTVTLKPGLKFSNGDTVTATDVVKSYDAALKSPASPYHAQAALFKSWRAGDGVVTFTLSAPVADPLLLLDVPIMQGGKSGVGCGPYKFDGDSLVPNDNYFAAPQIELIKLIDTGDDADVVGLFAAGELDVISSEQAGELSLASKRDYAMYSAPTNRLLFIGINHADERFADPALRAAMSACIDRQALTERALAGLADGTEYPFNPVWREQEESDTKLTPFEGEYTLLIPAGSDLKRAIADAVAAGFDAAGAKLTVTELEPAELESAVLAGNYELYLGETAISRTMDPTYLYGTGGSMNYSGFSSPSLDAAWESFVSGGLGLSDYLAAFAAETPVIPVLFRRSVIFCDKRIEGLSSCSPWNALGDFTAVRLK